MARAGDIVADRFRLLSPLGEGGMGAVWRAHHIHLEVPVALKLMKTDPPPGERLLRRFEREAKMAAKINSAHVVRILDHGYHDGFPFIAMELMDGRDLRARLDEDHRLSLAETVAMVRHVSRALIQAHDLGLVHRDIKPENIFITTDEDGRALYKVLDFGVVKVTYGAEAASSSLATAQGVLVGTPYYLSPEQAEATGIIDHRSDLWSLGVVAFECLTGRRPFDAPSLGTLIVEILNSPAPRLADVLGPECPGAVEAWMRKALAKSPDERFGDAKLMAEGLTAAADLSQPWSEAPPRAVISGPGGAPTLGTGDTLASDDDAAVPTSADDGTVDAPMAAISAGETGTLEGAAREDDLVVPTPPRRGWWLSVAGLAGVVAAGVALSVLGRSEPADDQSAAPAALHSAPSSPAEQSASPPASTTADGAEPRPSSSRTVEDAPVVDSPAVPGPVPGPAPAHVEPSSKAPARPPAAPSQPPGRTTPPTPVPGTKPAPEAPQPTPGKPVIRRDI